MDEEYKEPTRRLLSDKLFKVIDEWFAQYPEIMRPALETKTDMAHSCAARILGKEE